MKLNSTYPWLAAFCATSGVASAVPLDMKPIATLPLAGAEIVAFDEGTERLFVTSSGGLQIVSIANPAAPTLVTTIDFTTLGLPATDVTSVSVFGGVAAVALPAPVKTDNGRVAFVSTADGSLLGSVEVGALPDSLTFTPDGSRVLVANEGELAGNINTDAAAGTVSIIDVSGGFVSPTVTSVGFTAYDSQVASLRAAGVRIFEGATPSLDFEPEYIAVSPDSTKAMVTLQEANAVAILDIAAGTFTAVVPLGEKDYSGLLADFSDRDGPGNTTATRLTRGNPVFGLYMPDAIASYSSGGNTYYVIANEGDDRDDFLSPDETIRVGSSNYVLDPSTFPDAAALKSNAVLGRLTVSNAPGLRGDSDNDTDIDRILSYGGRSFSILDESGNQVYDSGDLMERAIASFGAPWFDDTRSDNKAIEPEGVITAGIGGRQYAFITLERSRGVMAFDVTDPTAVTAAGFATVETDLNPEDLAFIPAADSPNGQDMIAVTNESSNTLTLYTVNPVDFTLQILHLADAEAGLLAPDTAPNLAALVDAFEDDHSNTLILSGGDSFIPGPFLNAGTDPSITPVLRDVFSNNSLSTAFARPDIAIHNIIGVEASALGNHEFDLGSNVLADAIAPASNGSWIGASYPHLTANISFAGDPLNSRFTSVPLDGASTPVPDAATQNGRIVPTATITKGGEKIGLVGVTTQVLESISSPSGARVLGFAEPRTGVNDMDLLATQVQPFIDELIAEGVDKIVLLSHLQQLDNERLLATKLSGVDIILAAGSNTRLGDADDVAVEFPGHAANFADTYPVRTAGVNGDPVLIINTDNEFTYLGRLVVDFDADGRVIVPNLAIRSIESGAYAATDAQVAAAWGVDEADLATTAFATGTKGERVSRITDAIESVILLKDGTVFGFTDVYLEGERVFVRSEETNLGNLTADANIAALRSIVGGTAPIVTLKNGGGIRAQIGAVSSQGGSAEKVPPLANPAAGKPAGAISKLDIENALRFNNGLMAVDITPANIKALLEHGLALGVNAGRFPQVGGMAYAWDPTAPAGERVQTISLIGEDGLTSAAIYANGGFVAGAPAVIQMVTLNFLANGGDSYPFKDNGDNFRFLLDDGTLSAPVPETENYSSGAPSNMMREQQALEEYLASRHATAGAAFSAAETPLAEDTRIQRVTARADMVLPFTAAEMIRINRFTIPLLEQGVSPSTVATSAALADALDETEAVGQQQVIDNSRDFGLFTAPGITLDGVYLEFSENATVDMKLQSSGDLENWTDEATVLDVDVDLSGDRRFFRFAASQD